jgi:hypothetical protein
VWLKSQLGCQYDYWSIILFLRRPKKYKKDSKWFCSELASHFLYKIKKIREPNHLVSPWELYTILKSK